MSPPKTLCVSPHHLVPLLSLLHPLLHLLRRLLVQPRGDERGHPSIWGLQGGAPWGSHWAQRDRGGQDSTGGVRRGASGVWGGYGGAWGSCRGARGLPSGVRGGHGVGGVGGVGGWWLRGVHGVGGGQVPCLGGEMRKLGGSNLPDRSGGRTGARGEAAPHFWGSFPDFLGCCHSPPPPLTCTGIPHGGNCSRTWIWGEKMGGHEVSCDPNRPPASPPPAQGRPPTKLPRGNQRGWGGSEIFGGSEWGEIWGGGLEGDDREQ